MESRPVLTFTNPATGEQFGQVEMTSPDEVRQSMADLRRLAPAWSQTPLAERVRLLRKFQAVLVDSLDEITAVLNQDCGKSRQDGLLEVFMTLDFLQYYLKHAAHWLRRRRKSSGLYLFKRCYVEPRPYGVVGVISPWNYPFALSVPPVVAALLAGNTVLLKPSEVAGATGVLVDVLFRRVPELAPYVRVQHGDGAVGAAMVQAAPDYIFLTGSTATGRKVMQAAAEHLIPVACELGGKDAMIVLEDADLPAAAHWGAWGAYFNTGQTCMGVERVYVVEQVYDEFVRLAVEETHRLKMGYCPDLECEYYLGPVSDPRQVKIIERHLNDALEKGARLLTGGRLQDMFFEPAVLVDVDHSMLVMREETFGPLLPIMKVKDEAEALRLANDCALGLGGYVWSRDLPRARRVAAQMQAGTVLINDTVAQFAIPSLPFGGIKQTGHGRTHGKEGLLQFTYSYAMTEGQPPPAWDVATIARKPGNYALMAGISRLVFGVTPRQRVQPLAEALKRPEAGQIGRRALGAGAALGAAGALAALALARSRKK